jgi:hypothetical protein
MIKIAKIIENTYIFYFSNFFQNIYKNEGQIGLQHWGGKREANFNILLFLEKKTKTKIGISCFWKEKT